MLHQELEQDRDGTSLSSWWLSASMATAQIDAKFRLKVHISLSHTQSPSHGLVTQLGTDNVSSAMNNWRL